jgi:hypothetical protein
MARPNSPVQPTTEDGSLSQAILDRLVRGILLIPCLLAVRIPVWTDKRVAE